MLGNNLRFIDALVVQFSERSGAFYAYSHEYSKDIIIDSCYCPKNSELVGKWISVGIDSRYRARETVTILADIFPTRIVKKNVEVKVEVEHDGRTNENIEMFRNDYFGYICDPNRLLYDIRSGVKYDTWIVRFKADRLNCRWRVSTEQDNIEPYFINSTASLPTTSVSLSESLETVIGIVTCHAKMGNFWLAWSDARPRSTICLDYDFCPANLEIIGKWAEFRVNERHRVCEPVKIISPLFETRIASRQAEFRVDFQHVGRYKQDYEIFYHPYFGNISDAVAVLDTVDVGAWYTGWIVYGQNHESNSFWKLTLMQKVEGPFKNSPERDRTNLPYNRNCSISSRSSRHRSRSSDMRTRRNSVERTENMPLYASSSPDIINHYDQGSSTSRTASSRSDEIRGSNVESNDYPSHKMNVSPRNSYRESSYSESTNRQRRRSHSAETRNHPYSRSIDAQDNFNNFHNNTNTFIERTNEHSTDSHNRNHSEISETKHNIRSEKITNNISLEKSEKNSSKPSIPLSNCCSDQKGVNSKFTRSHVAEENKTSTKTEQEKQMLILKQRLSRISELVLSLTNDESVSMPMKMWNVEEYEELVEMAKKSV